MSKITYNGLVDQPDIRKQLDEVMIDLIRVMDNKKAHLSDCGLLVSMAGLKLQKISTLLFKEFEVQTGQVEKNANEL